MQAHWNMNKTVGYENPIKCCSLSTGTHERDSEYTSIVLYLHGASCEGSAESFGRKFDRGLCPAKASARDWTLAVFAACVCTLCSVVT